MKKLLAVLAFALFSVTAHADVQIGKPAPDISFKDIKGNAYSIKGLQGKTVVLEWTNPGCPFVHKFYDSGSMQKFQQTKFKNLNIVWIAVNSGGEGKEGYFNTDAEAQKWADEHKFAGTAYIRDPSGAFGKLYGAKTSPHMFIIDAKGNVAYQGAIDSVPSPDPAEIAKADNHVLKGLQALSDGSTPKVTSTQPYGCSVKYAD